MRAHLQATVPPRIRHLLWKGGPNAQDYQHAQEFALTLGTLGDTLMFPPERPQEKKKRLIAESREAMRSLSEGVAILSFCAGGITVFGLHFDANTFKAEEEQRDEDEREDALATTMSDFDAILQAGMSPPTKDTRW